MGDQKRDPGQQTKDGSQVYEVTENSLGVVRYVHEGSAAEERRDSQGRNGYTALVGPKEDLGSMAFAGKTVDCTGSDVEIGVGCAEGKQQDAGVDDRG